MKKRKFLFALSFAVVSIFIFSTALAKSENAGGVNSQAGNKNFSAQESLPFPPSNAENSNLNSNNGRQETISPSATSVPSVSSMVSLPAVKRIRERISAQEHRSVVANLVQSLAKVADREKTGIGEQVRVIARQQNEGGEVAATAMERIQNRSKIRNFIFGPDYKNLGQLRSEMVQIRNRVQQLTRLMNQASSEENKAILREQIQVMEEEQQGIENFLAENENKFSLLGWVKKLFTK